MSDLAIMTRDLTGFFMTPNAWVSREAYESDKAWHLNPDSYMYGAVLVEMAEVPDGWTLITAIQPGCFTWRPAITWLSTLKAVSWLWFKLTLVRQTRQVPGRIIADHLAAQQEQEKN